MAGSFDIEGTAVKSGEGAIASSVTISAISVSTASVTGSDD